MKCLYVEVSDTVMLESLKNIKHKAGNNQTSRLEIKLCISHYLYQAHYYATENIEIHQVPSHTIRRYNYNHLAYFRKLIIEDYEKSNIIYFTIGFL